MSLSDQMTRIPPALNRLSFKIALPVALSSAAAVLAWRLVSTHVPLLGGLAWSVVLGIIAYVAAHATLARRLGLARTMLEQIQRRQFEALQSPQLSRSDELDALVQQLYRAGRSVEKEVTAFRQTEDHRHELLGNVSHELKTPIFAIQGYVETLLGGALDDDRVNRAFLEKILRNTNRLDALSRDLSEISRLETGQLRLDVAPFGLQQVAREVMESLVFAAESQHVTLRQRIPDELPAVLGDRERIRQVLLNLVENAIKYNTPGGWVEIKAVPVPRHEVGIAVVDSGIGVAAQDIPRLTERFFRVDKSRSREQGGTGLGLAIVKHILGAHGRSLSIESEPGHGSTFAFTLPTG